MKGSLSKQLLSLLLSIILVIDTGFAPGMTGYASEHIEESQYGMYAVKAIASLPKEISKQRVTVGTKKSKLRFPKFIYALATKETETDSDDSESSDSEENTVSNLKRKATDSETSTAASIASNSETDYKLSSQSILNRSIDYMTDEQKSIIEKLLSSDKVPVISEIEEKTNLDLSGYRIIKLNLDWENNLTLGGEYDPDVPGVYTFDSYLQDESQFELYSVTLPTITVEVTKDIISTASNIYPVYVKTENVNADGNLNFVMQDLENPDDVTVLNFNSDNPDGEEIPVENGTFSIPLRDTDSAYFFDIIASDSEIKLRINTEGTEYQSHAGTGTAPITLTAEKAGSETFDNENCFMVIGKSPLITVKSSWEDGGKSESSKNNLVGQNINDLLYLEYFIENKSDEWKRLDSKALTAVLGHPDKDADTVPSPSKCSSSYTVPTRYTYSFADALYDTYVERDEITGELSAHKIKYRLAAEDTLNEHYYSAYEDENGNILRNYEITNFTAKIKWNDTGAIRENGNNVDRPSIEEWLNNISLYKILKGDTSNPKKVALISDSAKNEGSFTVSDDGNNEWSINIKGYGYDKDNYPVHYYITEGNLELSDASGSEGNVITDRHYEVTYENVHNASDKTNGLYDGGTLINTLSGKTNYVVYCKWMDEADTETVKGRPVISIILYRYANDQNTSRNFRWSGLSPIQNSKYVEIKKNIGTEKDGNINRLYRLTLPENDSLDAYNTDGAELIYAGKVKKKGSSATYETSLNTKSGENRSLYENHFILNGETLQNLIKDSVSVKATKTWKAAARQDVDSEVTLSLYKTTQDPVKYPDTYDDERYATRLSNPVTLNGFTSERQSRSTESVLEKYDENGNRLYYFSREEKVTTRNKENGLMEDAVIFRDNDTDCFLTKDGYRYIHSYNSESASDNQKITITNTLVGNAQILITKTFPTGLSDSDKERGFAEVTFDIYQNSKKIGTVTRTYKKGATLHTVGPEGDESETAINRIEDLYDSFTDQILIDSYEDMDREGITGAEKYHGQLPRYDENGAEYTYTAYEHGNIKNSGYFPTVRTKTKEKDRRYTLKDSGTEVTEKYLQTDVNIINSIGGGNYISVYKEWNDGSDSEAREPVHFVLEYNANGKWEQIGTEYTINPSSENCIYIPVPDEYTEEYLKWKKTKSSDIFRVRETHIGNVKTVENEVHYYEGSDSTIAKDYPSSGENTLYLGHEWEKYNGDPEAFSKLTREDDEFGFVKGSKYVYDVLIRDNISAGQKNDSADNVSDQNTLGSSFDFTISNMRVGVVYIDINAEQWLDGVLKAKARPDEIILDMKIGDKVEPVTLNEKNGWKKRLGPFRKYDTSGNVINYNPGFIHKNGKLINYVYNNRKNDEELYSGAYILQTQEAVTLGDHHTGDIYSFTLRHELKDSIVPTVNKFWEDSDSADGRSNKRPDIVVNLYRTYTDKDNNYHIEQLDKDKYINFEWDTTKDSLNNWWQVSYDPQPRFSSGDYYEYTYYIKESMPSKNTNEYVEIGAFPDSPKDTGNGAEYSYAETKPGLMKLQDGTMVSAALVTLNPDKAWTIVNRKRNKRTVSGVKIYKNLPDGFRAGDLPKIKIELWRKTSDGKTEEPVYEYVQGKDSLLHETLIKNDANRQLTAYLGNADENGITSFTFYNKNGKTAYVPKYDDKGRLYTYFIKEVNDKDTAEGSEDSKLLHHLFELTTDDTLTNGIVAVNGYKPDTGYEITFYKNWTADKSEKSEAEWNTVKNKDNPYIKVRLYRYLQNDSGIISGSQELIKTNDSDISDSNTDITLMYDPDHPEYTSYTWKKLPYYAPNLKPYVYVVSERAGDENKEFCKVFEGSVSGSEGNISLIGSGKNLYDLKTESYTHLTSEGGKKISHDSGWTGYDTVVKGSYVIDASDNYKGSGTGTAGIINVYTGVPEDKHKPSETPEKEPEKNKPTNGTDVPKEADKKPANEVPEDPNGDHKNESQENPDKEPEKELPANGEKPDSTDEIDTKPENNEDSGTKTSENSTGENTTSQKHNTVHSEGNSSSDDAIKKSALDEGHEITFIQLLPNDKYNSSETEKSEAYPGSILNASRQSGGNEDSDTRGIGKKRSPKTGDSSRMSMYGFGTFVAIIVMIKWYIIFKRRKKQ
ncbi:Cna B-type domain-containing protein [Oribacterium sp. WCC10]|uniref:Cna B-type domain-containing protein n=1 Tax=Oribacterium sp. WCC10 TaxID=1855343 RepID=UPI0008EDC257|nr:Cna B-type domain-containing protein [Oribacterium sp. WCC10]SFG41448.1 hypothetical protein SAMN05216356_1083 [Oribacterium sp. WCC10]